MTRRRWLLVGGLTLLIGIAAYPTMIAVMGDVPAWARDLNCNGRVSVAEWYDAGIDHGWRRAVGGPTDCMEVFRLKDGIAVVLRCETNPRCRPPPR